MKYLVLVPVCLVLTVVLACVTGSHETAKMQAQAQAQTLADVIDDAISDGTVTPPEAKRISLELGKTGAAMVAAVPDEPLIPTWLQTVGQVAGTLALGYFGIRRLPNRHIIGEIEAAALDRASGFES